MEAKIQKQIIDYFSYFEEFHSSLKTCLKDCQNCVAVINKHIARCNKIKNSEVSGTPLEEFPDLQSKLSAIIHNLISEEICEIKTHQSKLEDLFEQLCNKHKIVQENCRYIDWQQKSPLITGTPYQPPLKQLLEFFEDSLTFGSEICALIETALKALSFKELNTESLIENFKISTTWNIKISEILNYTSFLTDKDNLI